MKITEDVRKYAAEQGIAEEEALKRASQVYEKRKRGLLQGLRAKAKVIQSENAA